MIRACAIAALLAAILGGCSSNVGSIQIKVVTAPAGRQICKAGVCTPASADAGPDSGAVAVDLFADVTTIRVTVTGPDLMMEVERPIKARAAGLEDVPVGPDRQVMVEGLNPDRVALMRGRTAPFEVKEGTTTIELFVGRVDRFSYINTKQLQIARAFHTATLLPDDRVLLTGGISGNKRWTPLDSHAPPPATAAAELINSNALQTKVGPAMASPRMAHTATLTTKGSVLIVGGAAPPDAGPPADASTEDAFVPPDSGVDLAADGPAPDAADPDSGAADAAPADGATADAAQTDSGADAAQDAAIDATTGDAETTPDAPPPPKPALLPLVGLVELFDPVNNKFSRSNEALMYPRFWHGAASTQSSVVLVGGASGDSEANASVELYVDGKLKPGVFLKQARRAPTVITLDDGTVMVSGGLDRSNQPLRTIELRKPGAPRFNFADPMSQPRAFHTATLLDSGEVLLVGGLTSTGTSLDASATVELFDPQTMKVTSLLTTGDARRWAHSATRLDNGSVLVAGGYRPETREPHAGAVLLKLRRVSEDRVLEHPAAQSMNEERAWHTATLLRSGAVLITGGRKGGGATSETAEVYIY